VPFFADVPSFMLKEPFFGRLGGHSHIQAFQDPVELRIGLPKAAMLGKDFLF
jgi:hypothetical protein